MAYALNSVYTALDYVDDRTTSDVSEIKRIKSLISERGWERLSNSDKEKYMSTSRHHLGILYGAKGCLNISDLNRYAWSCWYKGKRIKETAQQLKEYAIELGIDPSKELFPIDYSTHLYCEDYFDTLPSTIETLEDASIWKLGENVVRYDPTSFIDIDRLEHDIVELMKMEYAHPQQSHLKPFVSFDTVTIEQLNNIDYFLIVGISIFHWTEMLNSMSKNFEHSGELYA